MGKEIKWMDSSFHSLGMYLVQPMSSDFNICYIKAPLFLENAVPQIPRVQVEWPCIINFQVPVFSS